jgi:1,6-anhydro-N-acetylmuramate kinase
MNEELTQLRLAALEQQFGAVATALCDGDASQLESLSRQLQQMTVEFAQEAASFSAHPGMSSTQLRRIKALCQGFPVLRETLQRRQALVSQALMVAVPATQNQTYAVSSAGPFGAGPKASGRIQSFSA